jgi:hypothetical protein
MKTFLILVLSLALTAAAFMTRPGRREFVLYVADRDGGHRSSLERAVGMSKDMKFNNRVLWTDVERDGKILYTGAFANFFARDGQTTDRELPSIRELAKLLEK